MHACYGKQLQNTALAPVGLVVTLLDGQANHRQARLSSPAQDKSYDSSGIGSHTPGLPIDEQAAGFFFTGATE